ncbi:hypothetical protein U0129_19435 [Enterobacter hormaechei]|uniref:hypothetical protein n=1 Tax=Enterobacter hormaechei TaxID=158836 RepID=UPI0039C4D2EB
MEKETLIYAYLAIWIVHVAAIFFVLIKQEKIGKKLIRNLILLILAGFVLIPSFNAFDFNEGYEECGMISEIVPVKGCEQRTPSGGGNHKPKEKAGFYESAVAKANNQEVDQE